MCAILLLVVGCVINPALEHLSQGDIYAEQELWDEAIEEYTQAVELDPKLAKAYNNRGYAYFKKGQWDLAIAELSKAIELDPNHAVAYYNRGYAYLEKGQWDLAIADCGKAIELDPHYAKAYYLRGCAYTWVEQWDLATADLNKVTELSDDPAVIEVAREFIRDLEEAREEARIDLDNVQLAVKAMMLDNGLRTLPNPVTVATNDMSAFPDISVCGIDKILDPNGNAYVAGKDKGGYLLYAHDITGDATSTGLVDYLTKQHTKFTYTVDSSGTVAQVTTGLE